MPIYQKALLIATESHDGQYRNDGEPYIMHPWRVADNCTSEDEKTVAILHDVVEDTDAILFYRAEFPTNIEDAVHAISRKEDETYFDYIERCSQNELARKVKIMDILDNWNTSKHTLKPRYMKALKILFEKGVEL